MTDPTIAVLPFLNIGAEKENEYFSDGITEEIINALSQIENLKVISRTSSFYFKDRNIPLKEIAQQLGVANILEGSVRFAGNRVRITAQLIQASEDFHFWSESWDRGLENIFEIQDEISLMIAEKLREQSGHFEISDHLVEKQTENLDAYQYSLKARYHFNLWNPVDMQKSIHLYKKALELDPDHVESHVGIADAYSFMATTESMPREETWALNVEHTQKAHALDPENAAVHYQLANLAFFTEIDFQKAAAYNFRALELQPNYPNAQQYMAFLYLLCGKVEKAAYHIELAMGIDPLNQETLFYKAYYHYRTAEYGKALSQLEAILEKNPQNIPANIVRSYALLKLGQYDETLAVMDDIPDEIALPDERLGIRCLAYILKGDRENSARCFAELHGKAKEESAFQAHSYLFLAYVSMGKPDEAFAWLEEALQRKSSVLLLTFSDPLAENLHKDPRYDEFHRHLYGETLNTLSQPQKQESMLDDETVQEYTRRLILYMKDEEPYLNPGLSLRGLADLVEIHPNQLSWLLNQKMKKNFNAFINHYRVEHFKQLAGDPDNAHISLIGLAYESGFNSKTVFNTYFKKETGTTPSDYLKGVNSGQKGP